jgi:transcription elongation factor Elf1
MSDCQSISIPLDQPPFQCPHCGFVMKAAYVDILEDEKVRCGNCFQVFIPFPQ